MLARLPRPDLLNGADVMTGRRGRSLRERVLSRLIADEETGCLLWPGATNGRGYGRVNAGGGNWRYVHRLMFEWFTGPIPDGMELDHLCRVRNCAAPAHLEAVTHRVNTLRGTAPAARHAQVTHCPYGHEYDEANTYLARSRCGGVARVCRACGRRRKRLMAAASP